VEPVTSRVPSLSKAKLVTLPSWPLSDVEVMVPSEMQCTCAVLSKLPDARIPAVADHTRVVTCRRSAGADSMNDSDSTEAAELLINVEHDLVG